MLEGETMTEAAHSEPRGERIGRVLNDFLDRRARGERVVQEQLYASYPDLADELRNHFLLIDALPVMSIGPSPDLDEESPRLPIWIPGYQIVREIHRGGQGVVYEAIQEATKTPVAIKVLLEGSFADRHSKRRFKREINLVSGLRHPHIVRVHDSGLIDGKYYYVMEYVSGTPLNEYVQAKSLSITDTIRLFSTICDAIEYAHCQGVIHRDLKPGNLLVTDDGTPCVLDFGLAKVTDTAKYSLSTMVSHSGNLMGTLAYMSPEQTMGRPSLIDTRTDVYALGVVLYQALTGLLPYDSRGDLEETLRSIRQVDPPRPSRHRKDIDGDVDAIVLKAMEKEPARRYRSAGDLKQDMDAWLDKRPIAARSASSLYLLRKIAIRHSFETAVLACLLITMAAFGIISFGYYLRARDALDRRIESERQSQLVTQQMEDMTPGVRSAIARHSLGWFLDEWHSGRLDGARRVHSLTASGDPAYAAAMAFLLDERCTFEELCHQLPQGSESLAHFVAGERALQYGRLDEARQLFSRSAATLGDDWIVAAARSRLNQLGIEGGLGAGSAAPTRPQ